MADEQPATSAEPAEALAALVARLRTELAGVRTAMRNRAVIEQAKGVLVERLGITPDQGFDHLVRLSQRANIKLIEVAAAIVGTTAPNLGDAAADEAIDEEYREHLARTRARRPLESAQPTAPVRRRQIRPPAIEALQAKHQLISGRVSAARDYDEIAEAVGAGDGGWPAPEVVALLVLEPDGALRTVGSHGLTPELRSQWRRIPPDPGLPIVTAVRDTEVVWLPDPETGGRRFPLLSALPFATTAVFAAPLVVDGRVVGGVLLGWDAPIEGQETRRYLTALVGPIARRVVGLQGGEIADAWGDYLTGGDSRGDTSRGGGGQAEVWLPAVLDTMHTPAMLLAPLREGGQVVDFHIEYANGLARRALTATRVDLDESTLLAVYPGVGSGTLLPAFTRLLHGGDPVRLTDVHVAARAEGIEQSQHLTIHAVRLWDRVLMIFRVHTDADLLHDQLLEAERIAHIGSFSWDLRTGEPRCSPQLYRMYHGDERTDSIRPDELADCVHPEDLATLRETVHRSVTTGKSLATEFRGGGRMAGRRLRVTAEPVVDPDGATSVVRGTVQDVTAERAREGRLRLAEEALAAQRRHLEGERRAAEALQQALLPTAPELGVAEGVDICGRCRATAKTGDVDGDWYDAMPLKAGSATALMLGDVADTGLSSMTIAARLRYAVRAYASLDMPPGDILTAVNAMLWTMDVEHTATLLVGRYDPATRQLRWAAAGQVAPIRYDADKRGSVLSGPLGLPLGSAPEVHYHEATVTLAEGDRVLFYTDGLVRADRRRSGALDVLLRAGQESDLGDIDALVDHITGKLGARPDQDMCAMLVRVTR